jgi:hypothetical protein
LPVFLISDTSRFFPSGLLLPTSFLTTVKRTKNPVVIIGKENIIGVELLIDVPNKAVQFYALTSASKGNGRGIVDAVVSAIPEDWFLAVLLDWSGGFWEKMAQEYPRLSLC